MNKSNYFLAVLISVIFVACAKVEVPASEPENEPEYYSVSLTLGGEYVSVSEMPLGKAYTNTSGVYYAVNVYSMKTDGSEDKYSHYAYGVFDNVDDMVISLAAGHKYKFECTTVKNGKDKVYIDYNSSYFSYPFHLNFGLLYTKDMNKFLSSDDVYIESIGLGKCVTGVYFNNYVSRYTPALERFYGELEDFVPSTNKSAAISMKRTGFGLKFTCQNLSDGSIQFSIKRGYDDAYTYPASIDDSIDYISFYGVKDAWQTEDYSETLALSIMWTRDNGFSHTIYKNDSFVAKRNALTVFNINLKDFSGTSLGFNEETDPVSTENINIDFTTGDTNVTPQE